MDVFDVFNAIVWVIILFVVVREFFRSVRIVSTRTALIVERLGQYRTTHGPGFHVLLPFIDKVSAIQDLKEETIGVLNVTFDLQSLVFIETTLANSQISHFILR